MTGIRSSSAFRTAAIRKNTASCRTMSCVITLARIALCASNIAWISPPVIDPGQMGRTGHRLADSAAGMVCCCKKVASAGLTVPR